MKYLRNLLFLLAIGMSANLSAQFATGYQNIIVGENNCVMNIVQDRDGIIWVGAGHGLYSYDGYNCIFHRLTNRSGTNFNTYCIAAHDGYIYLGSDQGLFIYDRLHGSLSQPESSQNKDIRTIVTSGRTLFLGCMEGLFTYNLDNHSVQQLCPTLKTVYSLQLTPKGILAGSFSGLHMVRGNNYTTYPIHVFVNSLAHDQGTRYWIGTEGNLLSLDIVSNRIETFSQLKGNSIKSMAKDRWGRLVIGTDNGLYVKEGSKLSHFVHDSGNPLSLGNNIIWRVFIDKQQNLWLGNEAGLSLMHAARQFKRYRIDEMMRSNEGNYLHELYIDRRGTLWAGGTNGLIRYSTGRGTAQKAWFRQGNTTHPLSHNRIRKVYEDPQGDIWVATDGGINLYRHAKDQMRNFVIYNKNKRHNARWAYDIFLDSRQRLWVAAYDGGIFVVSKQKLLASNGECVADEHYTDGPHGLSGFHVQKLLPTHSGTVWTVSNGGIDIIDPARHRVTHVTDNYANCILEDRRHRVWMAYDGGIKCYDAPDKAPVTYDFSGSGFYKNIVSMQEADGRIWAFSRFNCRVIDDNGHVNIFRLPDIGVSASCYSPLRHEFYVGGTDEMVTFSPKIVSQLNAHPRLLLTNIKVNNTNFSDYHHDARFIDKLQLKSSENNLTLNFTDIPYKNQVGLLYAYRLKGSSDTWYQLDPRSLELNFAGLPHGSYELEIAAIDGLGHPLATAYRLPICILPPWYLAWWAKLLYLVFTLALVLGFQRYIRVRRNLTREQQERQSILEQQEARNRFFHQLSREMKTPIANAFIGVGQLLEHTHTDETIRRLGVIQQAATQMNTLIRHAFDLNNHEKTQPNDLVVHDIDLNTFCQQMVRSMQQQAARRNIELQFEAPERHLHKTIGIVRFDAIMYILLRFVVNNTISNGHVVMTLALKEDRLLIILTTDRPKFTENDVQHIFERYPANHDSAGKNESNTELYLAREYVQAMQGELYTRCNNEGGIDFCLSIPNGDTRQAITSTAMSADVTEKTTAKNEVDNRLMNDITATIEKHIMDFDFNVSMLQYELGIGNKLLYRKVKLHTGQSPVEYIRNIRMNRAALLLKEGRFSVSEVMYMVGFTNSSYFSKCFQKSYGTTPTKFCRRSRHEPLEGKTNKH